MSFIRQRVCYKKLKIQEVLEFLVKRNIRNSTILFTLTMFRGIHNNMLTLLNTSTLEKILNSLRWELITFLKVTVVALTTVYNTIYYNLDFSLGTSATLLLWRKATFPHATQFRLSMFCYCCVPHTVIAF